MQIKENYPLKSLNTFGINATARHFVEITSVGELQELITTEKYREMDRLILGGGSNILLTGDFTGLVVKINILGKQAVNEDENSVTIKTGAGENWHQFVLHCIGKDLAGVENLSLIPGNIGAAPIQNIGAYGVELTEVFKELEAVDAHTGELQVFSKNDCQLGYRSSIFKDKLKGKMIITSVSITLSKKPRFNTSYGAIEEELEQMGVQQLTVSDISQAVCNIRRSKLPDPEKIGNAGSFFKNPVLENRQFEELQSRYPDIAAYPDKEGYTKVAAGWLIDQAGWKGKRVGECGVHERQALVLVNYGNAKGQQIRDLAEEIRLDINEKFGIGLEQEVNMIN